MQRSDRSTRPRKPGAGSVCASTTTHRAGQLRQHPIDIEQAGRLRHPGDNQIPERLVADRVIWLEGLEKRDVNQPAAAGVCRPL
jgi:hypothetical protein